MRPWSWRNERISVRPTSAPAALAEPGPTSESEASNAVLGARSPDATGARNGLDAESELDVC
ncbi:hypothetical protein ACWDKQ_03625 [Saccharopolyspora sp. NPDC000995]